MSFRSRGHLRDWNTAVGLLSLPVLVVSAATGIALFALLSGLVSGLGPMALLAVHVYSGLLGLPLVVAKTVTGVRSWRARPRRRRADSLIRAPWTALTSLLLVVSVLSLYGSGTLLHLNLTPGGNAGYKTVHLWSAVATAPLVTHHLVRHLRLARVGVRHTLSTADDRARATARRRVLVLGGAGVVGWALARLASRAGEAATSSGPNDFPVTIAASGSDQPDPSTWRLEVIGDVADPQSFTLADLRGIGLERHRYSLDCILGWSVVREWGGVPLSEILDRCTPTGELLSGVFRSTTGYEAALLTEQLADRRSMVTLEVDGVALAPEHGFPARVMAPGVIGEKCVKWPDQLTVVCA
jgi:DMSO/TMAO reductase YedYZ molybdopterin-dependent catalytic subunit